MNSAAARSASAAGTLGFVFITCDGLEAVDRDWGWDVRVFVSALKVAVFCCGAEIVGLVFASTPGVLVATVDWPDSVGVRVKARTTIQRLEQPTIR